MTTWREVERVKLANPTWTVSDVAHELGCIPQYVTATAKRRGWVFPKTVMSDFTILRIHKSTIEPHCKKGETPAACLRRIAHRALARASAA